MEHIGFASLDTATYRFDGKIWRFQSAAHLLGQRADPHPTPAADPPFPGGLTTRSVGDVPPAPGAARSFAFRDEGHCGQHRIDFAPFHEASNAE